MSRFKDFIKTGLLRTNRLQGTLEELNILTYQDKIRLRMSKYRSPVLFDREGQDLIRELIAGNAPLMVSRLGSVELSCLHFYLKNRQAKKSPYSTKIKSHMFNHAGFFPVDDNSLDSFAELYLEELKQTDIMGVWFNPYEDVICNSWCTDAALVELACLEPYRFSNPWSAGLAGKKVLVVHPFAESIQQQYAEKRQLLFADPDVLPDFELTTLRAVQSIAGSKVEFTTWFDAYRHMCDEMAKTDFDICLIGAGAYGLPLASFAKSLGKQAIHMGGTTQILFGIKGRRWEQLYADSIAKLFNGHWIRPLESETPENKDRIEGGCYW
jgi:hypothetical protein